MLPEYKEPWKVVKKIGKGGFGTVYRIEATDELGNLTRKEALKVIRIPKSDEEIAERLNDKYETQQSLAAYYEGLVSDISKELNIMYKLRGYTNIVNYGDHIVRKHADGIGYDIMIQMQLLTSLEDYEKSHEVTVRDVIRLGIDICQALEDCQKFHIIHRDIKPANIFWSDSGEFRLGDFGIARTVEEHLDRDLSTKGTYNYMAPEMYKREKYGFDVDMYSLGLVMYKMLNHNRFPFCKPYPEQRTYEDEQAAFNRRIYSNEELPEPAHGRTRLYEIIKKACQYEPKDRYSSPSAMKEDLKNILYTKEELDEILNSDILELSDSGSTPQPPTSKESSKETVKMKDDSSSSRGSKFSLKNILIGTAVAAVVMLGIGLSFRKYFNTADNDDSSTGNVSQSSEVSGLSGTSPGTEEETGEVSAESGESAGPRTTSRVGDAGITINKEYDSSNNMIKESQVHADGTQGLSFVYTYPEGVTDDEMENWLTETSYHANGKVWKSSTREYEDGLMMKQSDFDADGKLMGYAVYEWNTERKKSGYVEYSAEDEILRSHSFTYMDNGTYTDRVTAGDQYQLSEAPDILDNVPIIAIEYEYSISGQQVKELDYDEAGKLLVYCENRYDYVKFDEEFRQTQQDWFLADGTVMSHAEYQYDDDGSTTDITMFDETGSILSYIKYEVGPDGFQPAKSH